VDYLLLKTVHVSCVVTAFALFAGRGVLMLKNSPLLKGPFLRIFPHLNDTLLLVSAIWMAVISRQFPFAEGWLTAKLAALIIYIGAGMIALSCRRAKAERITAWILAMLVFAYIVSVALTRRVLPFAFT